MDLIDQFCYDTQDRFVVYYNLQLIATHAEAWNRENLRKFAPGLKIDLIIPANRAGTSALALISVDRNTTLLAWIFLLLNGAYVNYVRSDDAGAVDRNLI